MLAELTFGADILAGQLAPSSMAMYRRDFEAYLRFAGSADAAVDAATLARWRTHLAQETDMSPNTINRMISAVKRLMREASIQGYVPAATAASFDNISGVKTAALKNRIKQTARVRIEPTAMRKMCDTPDTEVLIGLRDTALLSTLASSGLRVSEVVGLTLDQIRPKGTSYVVLVRGKNDVEQREAPLSREAFTHIGPGWTSAQSNVRRFLRRLPGAAANGLPTARCRPFRSGGSYGSTRPTPGSTMSSRMTSAVLSVRNSPAPTCAWPRRRSAISGWKRPPATTS